jgi:hypothetical protein
MDRTELKTKLIPFQERCAAKGKQLTDLCIEDAFPGDSATSFIVKVKAPWVDGVSCSEALDFLFEILWETTDEPTREKIFSIHVMDSSDVLHCWQETKDTGK